MPEYPARDKNFNWPMTFDTVTRNRPRTNEIVTIGCYADFGLAPITPPVS